MSDKTIKQRERDLINSYIKENMIDNNADQDRYPLELNYIILAFLGNVILIFDIVENELSKSFIYEAGKCIKGKDTAKWKKVGCSLPLNNRVTRIDVDIMEEISNNGNVIRIGSNIEECTTHKWWYQMSGYKYWWQCTLCIVSQYNHRNLSYSRNEQNWTANDIISINIDWDLWIMTFYLNNMPQYTFSLQRDVDYHLMISGCENFEYRLY